MDKCEYGYKLADRYIFRKRLGKGANGSVFLAYDTKLNKCWAVKVCNNYSKQELEALKKIDFFAFPRIVDVVHQDEKDYLVMDYIEGENLEKYRRQHALSERQILRMGRKIAEAMGYLHSLTPALLYMDCKPQNIIVTATGDIRLVDLGSVYVCDENTKNVISGTAFYAPGEVKKNGLHNNINPDSRSDIYSLGMTLYYLLTGCKVEYRDRYGRLCLRRQNRNITKTAEKIVRKCTATKMKDRYQNMSDLIKDINNVTGSGVNVVLTRIKENVKPVILGLIDITCKGMVCAGILINAYYYAENLQQNNLIICFLFGIIFLFLCRNKSVYSWENRKDIFRGAGARILFLIIIMTSALSGEKVKANSALERDCAEISQVLDVTLYDGYGHKLLVRPGAVWEISRDIYMSIPAEQISSEDCKITVKYDTVKEHKEYSFFCKYLR